MLPLPLDAGALGTARQAGRESLTPGMATRPRKVPFRGSSGGGVECPSIRPGASWLLARLFAGLGTQ
jgi:hypothetical protein